jgi:hypothetical protein
MWNMFAKILFIAGIFVLVYLFHFPRAMCALLKLWIHTFQTAHSIVSFTLKLFVLFDFDEHTF